MRRASEYDYRPALRFNWDTPFYDLVVGATTRERSFKQGLIRQAGIEARHQVLDLGSGTGTLAIWVKAFGTIYGTLTLYSAVKNSHPPASTSAV